MKITIDDELCSKFGLSFETVLAILLVKTGANLPKLFEKMLADEVLVQIPTLLGNKLVVTQRWDDVCANILLEADKEVPKEDRIEILAKVLMELFPKGKKEGTNTYWKGNLKDTKLRLKKFFKLYGDKFTNEEIIEATRKYIESFNGNYSYMRVLKYFIWKDTRKVDSEGIGYIEESSDLATFIENSNDSSNLSDWTTEIK